MKIKSCLLSGGKSVFDLDSKRDFLSRLDTDRHKARVPVDPGPPSSWSSCLRSTRTDNSSVADPDSFDTVPDPAFHFDTDPDPAV